MPYKHSKDQRAQSKRYRERMRIERPEHARARACRNAEAARARDPEGMRAYKAEWARKARANESPADKQKRQARRRISYRMEKGTMPHASIFTCCDCQSKPASEYHHETYDLWWAVEALCRTCHERRHHP